MNAANNRLLLTSREAAAMLSVSERTLWGVTHPRGDLPAVMIGRCVRYDPADRKASIARRWSRPTEETSAPI